MNLYQILTELDSRSKKTSPNIFNEAMNCGFEAETAWLINNKADEEKESKRIVDMFIKEWVKKYSSIKNAVDTKQAHNSDSVDSEEWKIVDDGSIRYEYEDEYEDEDEDEDEYNSEDSTRSYLGLEFISPVFPNIATMLAEMQSFFAWLKKYGITNETTGLHITMSMAEPQRNNINKLKLCMLAADENILKDFGRESHEKYSRAIYKTIKDGIVKMGKDYEEIKKYKFKDLERNIASKITFNNKKHTINIKGKGDKSNTEMVEFRSPGGRGYLKKENFYKIENAVKHYAVCLKAAYSDTIYEKDYKTLLYRFIENTYEYFEKDTGDDSGFYEELTPFLEMLNRMLFPYCFYECEMDMNRVYDIMYNKKEFNIDTSELAKDKLFKVLITLCMDIGFKNTTVTIKDYNILKKTLKDFGIKDVNIAELCDDRSRVANRTRLPNTPYYEQPFDKRVETFIKGYKKLFKIFDKSETQNFIKKHPLRVFDDSFIYIHDSIISRMNRDALVMLDKDSVTFQTPYKNNNRTILVIPKNHFVVLQKLYEMKLERTRKDFLNVERDYQEHMSMLWKIDVEIDISNNFINIYGNDLFNVMSSLSSTWDAQFCITKNEGVLFGRQYYDIIKRAFDISFIGKDKTEIIDPQRLIGPDGDEMFFENENKKGEIMNLYQVLTELDSRSKRTAPDIFNEPINCGFEAEIVWKNTFDHTRGGNIQYSLEAGLEWEEIKNRLAEIDNLEIIEKIENEAREKIKEMIQELDDASDAALEDGEEEESISYQEQANAEREKYENIEADAINEYITNYTEMHYLGNYMDMIKDIVGANTAVDIPALVIDNWIKPHSLIKRTATSWDNNKYSKPGGGNVDNDRWIFTSDGSIKSGHGTGMEIISPVYPNITTMLTDMRSLFEWLVRNNVVSNISTGLHITMSMAEQKKNDLNKIKLCVLASDTNILKDFDRDSEDNNFSGTITNAVYAALETNYIKPEELRDIKKVETLLNKSLFTGKHTSINFKGLTNEAGTEMVEFRSGGGKGYMEEENFHKIENAVKHYAICLKAAYSDTYYQDDYKKLLYRMFQRLYYNTRYDLSDEIEKRCYPFIVLMEKFMFSKSFKYCLHYLRESYDKIGTNEGQEDFIKIFLQLCADISIKKIKTSIEDYKVVKETMDEYGIEDIGLEEIQNYAKSVRIYMRDSTLRNKNRIQIIVLGYNELMKRQKNPIEYIPDEQEINNNIEESVMPRKNFKRSEMPQIDQESLSKCPYDIKNGKISVEKITPVQTEREKHRLERAKKDMSSGNYKRLIIDRDNYLVNGHHRYDAAKLINLSEVKVIKVDATVEELVEYFRHASKNTEDMKENYSQRLNNIMLGEMTGAASVASVAMPIGGMVKRPNPSVFPTKKKTKKKKAKKRVKEARTAKTKDSIDTFISGVESKIYSTIKRQGFVPMKEFDERGLRIIGELCQRNVLKKARKNNEVGYITYTTML